MFKKLPYLINSIIIIILLYLIANLFHIAGPMWHQLQEARNPRARNTIFAQECKNLKLKEMDIPDFSPGSRSRYAIIADKNLFRITREEWYPPMIPVDGSNTVVRAHYPDVSQRKHPELPAPTLMGIVIIGEEKKYAIIQGHCREEMDIAGKMQKRSLNHRQQQEKRFQIHKDEPKQYIIGDAVSEYQLVDILDTSIILEKEGIHEEIFLRNPLKLPAMNQEIQIKGDMEIPYTTFQTKGALHKDEYSYTVPYQALYTQSHTWPVHPEMVLRASDDSHQTLQPNVPLRDPKDTSEFPKVMLPQSPFFPSRQPISPLMNPPGML